MAQIARRWLSGAEWAQVADSAPLSSMLSWLKQRAVRLLEEHRAWVVLLFCLPASLVFDAALAAAARARRLLDALLGGGGGGGAEQRHRRRVRAVQRHVRRWNALPAAERRPLCTARPNWLSLSTTFFRKDLCHRVPVDLGAILRLDERALTVRVEPMVTVGQITRYLIPRGYTLAVTLELEDATLGGLAMGTGMSTHSHKAGLFHETVSSYEVVLGDGRALRASRAHHADLFGALPWSHGSLALLVALTVRVVRAKPYVRLTYVPVRGRARLCDLVRRAAGARGEPAAPDYVEATVFGRRRAVLTVGEPSDLDARLPLNRLARWYKPWFYKHAEDALRRGRHTELVPLRDYLLRHNRSIFWVAESLLPWGNAPLFRLLLGWLLPPKPAFLKWTTTPGVRRYTFRRQVFQDVVLPMAELERQLATAERLFDTYPLLVYPCRLYDRGPRAGQLPRPAPRLLVPGTRYAMYNDLGVYGVPGPVRRGRPYDPVLAMRQMERFARDVRGFSFLYADIFMTRAEFEAMFDLELYEAVRVKYGADRAFPHLYDKVRPEIDVLAGTGLGTDEPGQWAPPPPAAQESGGPTTRERRPDNKRAAA